MKQLPSKWVQHNIGTPLIGYLHQIGDKRAVPWVKDTISRYSKSLHKEISFFLTPNRSIDLEYQSFKVSRHERIGVEEGEINCYLPQHRSFDRYWWKLCQRRPTQDWAEVSASLTWVMIWRSLRADTGRRDFESRNVVMSSTAIMRRAKCASDCIRRRGGFYGYWWSNFKLECKSINGYSPHVESNRPMRQICRVCGSVTWLDFVHWLVTQFERLQNKGSWGN